MQLGWKTKCVLLQLQSNLFGRGSEINIHDNSYQQLESLTVMIELDIWMFVTPPRLVFLVTRSPSAPADCVSLSDATVASNHNLLQTSINRH